MNLFVVFTILITLTAVFSFVNEAFIKLPTTIGVMLASLASSILIIGFGYLLAEQFDVSAPLTCVVAGLFLARRRRLMPDSADHVRSYVKSLWEVIDDVMNAILFVLIGLEALVLDLEKPYIICGLISIPLITVARYVSVEVPLVFLKLFRNIPSLSGFIMTWSGIRGGVSIALALSLVDSPQRDLIVIMTYVVVVFSITVQGLTLENALKWNRSRTKSE
ncbi:MAG: cation:proton antiporter [Thermodesulfobacteriota bacterium]